MPLSAAPRSVSDATRFTATTPHANSKAAAPPPRFGPPKSGSAPHVPSGGAGGSGGGSNAGPSPFLETPGQKVARLRAAHLRAKEAQVSKLDKVISVSRRVLDSAHRVTVVGLVGFTVIAAFATAYTAFDMITHNKKRSAEWVERQKRLEADSLEAARIAYMTGKATEEQIALVEEQLERERETGRKTSFFSSMPSVLGTPESANAQPPSPPSSSSASTPTTSQSASQPRRITETVSWPAKDTSTTAGAVEDQQSEPQQQKTGLWNWLTSNLKREEGDDEQGRVGSSQRRLGRESLGEEEEGTGVRESDIVRAVGDKQAYLRSKAQAAFEREKDNQRRGGPLDRVGVEAQHVNKAEGILAADAGKGVAVGEEQPKKRWFW